MDRKSLREFTHKAESFLKIDNDVYKQWVFRYTFLELEKDLGLYGDITTKSIFQGRRRVNAKILAKGSGVFAGRQEIQYFLVDSDTKFKPSLSDNFVLEFNFQDGEIFKTGDTLLTINADLADLLAVERVCLNLLMRMSGVATYTKKILDKIHEYDVLVTPTRKTLWGLLDKRAVVLGGGGTHRVNLADAILVKDTHLDLLNRDFAALFQNLTHSVYESRFLEIEVNSAAECLTVLRYYDKFLGSEIKTIGVILMDNMSAEQVSDALELVKKEGLFDKALFEASGGINEDNVLQYAKTGVDIISMGTITSGVKSVDMSLKIMVGEEGLEPSRF